MSLSLKVKVKVTEKSKKIDDYRKAMKVLDKSKAEVGFFQSQGRHHSGLTYPTLMKIHEYGGGNNPIRPVFRIATRKARISPKRNKYVKSAFNSWVKAAPKRTDPTKILEAIGESLKAQLKPIFGSNYLTVTSNPTPLVDTGDLASKVTFRISTESVPRTT